MILPTKHLPMDGSLLGQGASILSQLTGAKTVSRLWEEARAGRTIVNFDNFVLTLAFLYAIGTIDLKDGLIRRTGR